MKKFWSLCLTLVCCTVFAQADVKNNVNQLLDNWHKAAAEANYNAYFGAMSQDAVYIGTDATENWNLTQFQQFSKPYFDKGKAWDFKPYDRHLFFTADKKTVWFDELLDTWMGICRGSGVLQLRDGQWKIVHYVLSMTVPNDDIDAVVKTKKAADDKLREQAPKK